MNSWLHHRLVGFLVACFAIVACCGGSLPARAAPVAATAGQQVAAQARTSPAVEQPDIHLSAERALSRAVTGYDFDRLQELSSLREELARARDRSRTLADNGTLQTRILEAEIAALGPLPAEGKSEPIAVSERREQLDRLLATHFGPVLAARQRQARAAVLVDELDARIGAMQRDRLFQYNASPLDPRSWIKAAVGLSQDAVRAASALSAVWGGADAGRAKAQALLAALFAVLSVVAGFLLPRRVLRWIDGLSRTTSSPSKRLLLILFHDLVAAAFLAVAVMLIALAVILILQPVLPQLAWIELALLLAVASLIVMVAAWLGQSVLLSPFEELRIVHLEQADAERGCRLIRWLGLFVAVEAIIKILELRGYSSLAVTNMASALVALVGAWCAWQLTHVLRKRRAEPPADVPDSADDSPVRSPETIDFVGPIGRLARIVMLVTALAALAGFVALALEMFSSTVMTLALVAVLIYLQRTIHLVAKLLADGALGRFRGILHFVPMLSGILLTLAALPLLAIIWGYQSQEIGDALVALRVGIEFGDIRISFADVVTFALVFFAGYIVTRWVQRILRLSILPQFAVDAGATAAIVTIIGYVGIIAAALIAIATTGLDLTSLAFVAGALSVGLGFGLQSVVENFTSGIILLLERPVREGDWIEVGEHSGIVRKISVRSTRLETWDRHDIIIPNSQLVTESVKNLSLGDHAGRIVMDVSVAYDSDLQRVRELLLEIAAAHEQVLDEPPPAVTLDRFGDNAIQLRLFSFVSDVTIGPGVRSALNFEIARRFPDEGIRIPFPQREVHVWNETVPAPQ